MRKQTALVGDFASWIVIEFQWQDKAFFVSISYANIKNNIKNMQNRISFTNITQFFILSI